MDEWIPFDIIMSQNGIRDDDNPDMYKYVTFASQTATLERTI